MNTVGVSRDLVVRLVRQLHTPLRPVLSSPSLRSSPHTLCRFGDPGACRSLLHMTNKGER